MLFGKIFTAVRKSKGYTAQEVADAIHVSRSTYSRYENDLKEVEPDILQAIADFYNTTPDDFIEWRGKIKNPDYPFSHYTYQLRRKKRDSVK